MTVLQRGQQPKAWNNRTEYSTHCPPPFSIVILRSTRIVLHNLAETAVKKADIIIEPGDQPFGLIVDKIVKKILVLFDEANWY